uniref:DUF4258 domain-containing protein n=1 Tax=Angiostrongylus cantonensis TaxID=6313 RepID=A0A0K0D666_ANGCA
MHQERRRTLSSGRIAHGVLLRVSLHNASTIILAARRREKLILQMAACMQRMDERKFHELFPMFSKRHDCKNYHRVRLRLVEESINDMLKKLKIAPIYFENWTENEGAIIDIKLIACYDKLIILIIVKFGDVDYDVVHI